MANPDQAAANGHCGRDRVLKNVTIQHEAAGNQRVYDQIRSPKT